MSASLTKFDSDREPVMTSSVVSKASFCIDNLSSASDFELEKQAEQIRKNFAR